MFNKYQIDAWAELKNTLTQKYSVDVTPTKTYFGYQFILSEPIPIKKYNFYASSFAIESTYFNIYTIRFNIYNYDVMIHRYEKQTTMNKIRKLLHINPKMENVEMKLTNMLLENGTIGKFPIEYLDLEAADLQWRPTKPSPHPVMIHSLAMAMELMNEIIK